MATRRRQNPFFVFILLTFVLSAPPVFASVSECERLLFHVNQLTGFNEWAQNLGEPRQSMRFSLSPLAYANFVYRRALRERVRAVPASIRPVVQRVRAKFVPERREGRDQVHFFGVHLGGRSPLQIHYPRGMRWELGTLTTALHEHEHEVYKWVVRSFPSEVEEWEAILLKEDLNEVLAIQAEFYFARSLDPRYLERFQHILSSNPDFEISRRQEDYLNYLDAPFANVVDQILEQRGYHEKATAWRSLRSR